MRTTVDLADDVAAAAEALRREHGLGVSEAVNQLARTGMNPPVRPAYVHRSLPIGIRVDVSDVGAVFDMLDQDPGSDHEPDST